MLTAKLKSRTFARKHTRCRRLRGAVRRGQLSERQVRRGERTQGTSDPQRGGLGVRGGPEGPHGVNWLREQLFE